MKWKETNIQLADLTWKQAEGLDDGRPKSTTGIYYWRTKSNECMALITRFHFWSHFRQALFCKVNVTEFRPKHTNTLQDSSACSTVWAGSSSQSPFVCFALDTITQKSWNHLEAWLKGTQRTVWLLTKHRQAWCSAAACAPSVAWTALSYLQPSPNKKLNLFQEEKGSFEGHWSGSYCPRGRQIGPVKPHCNSDWNWFVVLLLHHPIKMRNLRECERGGRGRKWEQRSLFWPWHINGASGLISRAVAAQKVTGEVTNRLL